MCNQYNGYTNYETWNVSLWIDNDQGTYEMIKEMAEQAIEDADEGDDTAYTLSKQIKDLFEEENPLSDQASTYSDLLQAALDSVNWYEIAENWIETVTE